MIVELAFVAIQQYQRIDYLLGLVRAFMRNGIQLISFVVSPPLTPTYPKRSDCCILSPSQTRWSEHGKDETQFDILGGTPRGDQTGSHVKDCVCKAARDFGETSALLAAEIENATCKRGCCKPTEEIRFVARCRAGSKWSNQLHLGTWIRHAP
jgi:hypothetical protein